MITARTYLIAAVFFLTLLLVSCGGGGGGGSSSSASSPSISGSIQGNYSNATFVVFERRGTEVARTAAQSGGSLAGSNVLSFSLSVPPGIYKFMLITDDATSHQSIGSACVTFGSTDPVTAVTLICPNLYTFSQGDSLSLVGLHADTSGNFYDVLGSAPGLRPPFGNSGVTTSQEPTPSINGTWHFSRTITASTCTDKPAGFQDAPLATVASPNFINVTMDSGETFTGNANGNLLYVSEFQAFASKNTSASTYVLMTIASDAQSMTGTFARQGTNGECSLQGTLTASKQ